MIATAGGPEKVQVCRDLGAELVVDYRAGDFVDAVKEFTGGRGADVIYDPVGGDTYDRSTKCVAFEGRILVMGFTGGRVARGAHQPRADQELHGDRDPPDAVPGARTGYVHETHAALDAAARRRRRRPADLARHPDDRGAARAGQPRRAQLVGQDRRPLVRP